MRLYVVFLLLLPHSGNVEAISLHDIYIRAIGTMPITQALRRKDPGWEGLKKSNSTSFIHVYRYTGTHSLPEPEQWAAPVNGFTGYFFILN